MSVLAIKLNNCSVAEPCALCGETVDQDVGPALFMVDSYKQVCDECGMQHAPELVKLLRATVADGYDSGPLFSPDDIQAALDDSLETWF